MLTTNISITNTSTRDSSSLGEGREGGREKDEREGVWGGGERGGEGGVKERQECRESGEGIMEKIKERGR